MTSIRSRVVAGMGANAFGQGVTTLIQLASVPVFLHFWSVEHYGQWLLLSALPAYLALGDLGLGTVAMNRMTILQSSGSTAAARIVFQTALLMIIIMTVALFALSVSLIWLLPLRVFAPADARLTIAILVAGALLSLFSSLFDAVFRAAGQFARGTYLINGGRLLEWLGGIGGLLLTGSMLAVATGILVARVVVMLLLQQITARRFPDYPWNPGNASAVELRRMLRPALSFLTFPLGNALTMQGMSVVVGATLGPAALAVFNTYRTLSRIPVQILATFSRALWPEISRSFGAGDMHALRGIYRRGTVLSVAVCAAVCVAIIASGDLLLRIWTRGQIGFDFTLLALFLAVAFGNCVWQVGQVILSATNNHERLSVVYMLAAVFSVATAAAMPADWGVAGRAAATGLFELVLIVACHRLVAELVRQQ